MTDLTGKIREKLDWLDTDAVAPRLCVTRATGAIRAVLDLHKPDRHDGLCDQCGIDGQNVDCDPPCDTVRAIAESLGVSQ